MGAKSGWGSMTADGIKVTVEKWPVFFPSDFPRRPLMPRKDAETYPLFSWKISPLAPILG